MLLSISFEDSWGWGLKYDLTTQGDEERVVLHQDVPMMLQVLDEGLLVRHRVEFDMESRAKAAQAKSA
jgi:hypothetical protein